MPHPEFLSDSSASAEIGSFLQVGCNLTNLNTSHLSREKRKDDLLIVLIISTP